MYVHNYNNICIVRTHGEYSMTHDDIFAKTYIKINADTLTWFSAYMNNNIKRSTMCFRAVIVVVVPVGR